MASACRAWRMILDLIMDYLSALLAPLAAARCRARTCRRSHPMKTRAAVPAVARCRARRYLLAAARGGRWCALGCLDDLTAAVLGVVEVVDVEGKCRVHDLAGQVFVKAREGA